MKDCEKLDTCAFFIEFKKDKSMTLALDGLVRIYCKGKKQDSCLRRKVGERLGGQDKVPKNMMPNGSPLGGTDDSTWPEEVKKIIID
jgi:hypothetical protein